MVLTSVLVSVGLALFDITYKQIILSSAARQSQFAFYAADSALECALYWDQKQNAFSYDGPLSTIRCGNVNLPLSSSRSGNTRTTSFTVSCPGGGHSAVVTVYKTAGSTVCNDGTAKSCLFANGFNSCSASDPRRIERGLKVYY